MSVVARDGQKQVIRRGNPFAEIVRHYLSLPASAGEEGRGLSYGPLQKLRLRRVHAVVGRTMCGLDYSEIAVALG